MITSSPLFQRLRDEAASTFLCDMVRVTRPGARSLVAGIERIAESEVYVGPARMVAKASSKDGLQSCEVEFPWGAFKAQDGDVVTWTSADDPNLVGETAILRAEVPASATLMKIRAERVL